MTPQFMEPEPEPEPPPLSQAQAPAQSPATATAVAEPPSNLSSSPPPPDHEDVRFIAVQTKFWRLAEEGMKVMPFNPDRRADGMIYSDNIIKKFKAESEAEKGTIPDNPKGCVSGVMLYPDDIKRIYNARLVALKDSALKAGVSEGQLVEAGETDDPKAAIIDLIVGKGGAKPERLVEMVNFPITTYDRGESEAGQASAIRKLDEFCDIMRNNPEIFRGVGADVSPGEAAGIVELVYIVRDQVYGRPSANPVLIQEVEGKINSIEMELEHERELARKSSSRSMTRMEKLAEVAEKKAKSLGDVFMRGEIRETKYEVYRKELIDLFREKASEQASPWMMLHLSYNIVFGKPGSKENPTGVLQEANAPNTSATAQAMKLANIPVKLRRRYLLEQKMTLDFPSMLGMEVSERAGYNDILCEGGGRRPLILNIKRSLYGAKTAIILYEMPEGWQPKLFRVNMQNPREHRHPVHSDDPCSITMIPPISGDSVIDFHNFLGCHVFITAEPGDDGLVCVKMERNQEILKQALRLLPYSDLINRVKDSLITYFIHLKGNELLKGQDPRSVSPNHNILMDNCRCAYSGGVPNCLMCQNEFTILRRPHCKMAYGVIMPQESQAMSARTISEGPDKVKQKMNKSDMVKDLMQGEARGGGGLQQEEAVDIIKMVELKRLDELSITQLLDYMIILDMDLTDILTPKDMDSLRKLDGQDELAKVQVEAEMAANMVQSQMLSRRLQKVEQTVEEMERVRAAGSDERLEATSDVVRAKKEKEELSQRLEKTEKGNWVMRKARAVKEASSSTRKKIDEIEEHIKEMGFKGDEAEELRSMASKALVEAEEKLKYLRGQQGAHAAAEAGLKRTSEAQRERSGNLTIRGSCAELIVKVGALLLDNGDKDKGMFRLVGGEEGTYNGLELKFRKNDPTQGRGGRLAVGEGTGLDKKGEDRAVDIFKMLVNLSRGVKYNGIPSVYNYIEEQHLVMDGGALWGGAVGFPSKEALPYTGKENQRRLQDLFGKFGGDVTSMAIAVQKGEHDLLVEEEGKREDISGLEAGGVAHFLGAGLRRD